MKEETKIYHINNFLNDEAMSRAVYEVMKEVFLKRSLGPKDVEMLAAERLAFHLLNDSWKELEKYRNVEGDTAPPLRQVGL